MRRTDGPLTELVASEIRAWMGREEITRRELARRLHTTHTWVTTRIRGEVPIDLNDLQRIAEALGVPWMELLPKTSPVRPIPPTDGYTPPPKRPMIPRPRVSHPPFGGAVRTRPLSDIDQMTEPNRVVPADVWADQSATAEFDPMPPVW